MKRAIPLLTLAVVAAPLTAVAADPSADEIVTRADHIRNPASDYQVKVAITSKRPGGGDRTKRYEVFLKGHDNTLVKFVAPADEVGKKLLMKGHDLWIYLPAIRRPTRISLQQRLTGEVANGDIARADFAGDYKARIEGKETIEGKNCYKLFLEAKSQDLTYAKVRYWVEQGTFRPVKAEYLSLFDKPLKIGVFSDFKSADGELRPMKLTITDAVQKDSVSVLEYSDMKRATLSAELFNKNSLDKD